MKNKLLRLILMMSKYAFIGIVIQCLLFQLIMASDLEAQRIKSVKEVQVSFSVDRASIGDLFSLIEANTEFKFSYDKKDFDKRKLIILSSQYQSVENVLLEISKQAKLKFKQVNRVINVIKMSPEDLTANRNAMEVIIQNQTVTGRVTSEDAPEGLPGVNVIIKGIQKGTVTDISGRYSIDVPSKESVLVFSSVGYVKEEMVAGNLSVIDVVLIPDITALEEIVVTALGVKREERALGYAVQKVDGETLSTVKGVDVGTSLTGKIAGLFVKNTTEFAQEAEILIRGESPLLVIDGVPYVNMTLRDIPSDDIEDISVLKGATASALYGSRGGSGAIMITTKKGSAIKGLTVTVNSSTMFSAGFLAIPETQSTYGRLVNTDNNTYSSLAQGSWGVPMEGQEVIQWDPVSKSYQPMPYLPIGKDNFENFLEQGYVLNNNISVAQQGENGSLRASASWVKNKGQYPNSMFDKITYSLGGDMKINKFTLSSSIAYNKQTSPNIGFSGFTSYDPMYSLLVFGSPDYDVRQYKDYWVVPNETQNNSYSAAVNNPYFERNERLHSKDRDIFNGSLAVSYDFTPWLKATYRTGFDTYIDNQIIRISKGSFQGGGSSTVIKNGTQIWGESLRGSFNTGVGRGYSLNNDLLLSADRTFGDFNIDALIGGTIFYTDDEGFEARTNGGLSIPAYYSLKASVLPVNVKSITKAQQINSLFGRMALSWKNLAFIEGTLRNDWSSTLSKLNQSYLYPSVSTSFVVSDLLPEMNWLSFWKLRGSWTAAKNPADIYAINNVFTITPNAWGTLSSATLPTTLKNSDLFSESTETFEIGTAINVYNSRASLDVAYYNKRAYDPLKQADVSPTSGYLKSFINTDEEITRKGIEVTANIMPVKTDYWRWDISLNWSKYARYYTQLDSVFSVDQPWVKVGERADHFVLKDFQKDSEGNIIHNAAGIPLFSAYNSLYGYSDPDWIWGVNSTVSYRNFSLFISFDGRVGGIIPSMTESYLWRSGNHPESIVPERYLDATTGTANYVSKGVQVVSGTATYDTYGNIIEDTRVFEANDVPVTYKNYIERVHTNYAWGGSVSPLDAYSGTYFKVREISLTYNLPTSISSKFAAKGASVSVVGQNVFLWAKQFKYSDPDGGIENFSDPSIRYLGFNLKATF